MLKRLFLSLGLLLVSFNAYDSKYLPFLEPAYAQQQCVPISGTSKADQSSAVQCALNALVNTGGIVTLPAGTIYAQGLSLPSSVTLEGQGENVTTLMLPANATASYLLASATYVNGQTWANSYGGIRDLTLDGNSSQNPNGTQSLLIMQNWRFRVEDCGIQNSPLHGILFTNQYENKPSGGGMPENFIKNCFFDGNRGAGFFAQIVPTNTNVTSIADFWIQDSSFESNGSLGYYQIELNRSAGFHIMNNQFYSGTIGDLQANDAASLKIIGNDFDASTETVTVNGSYIEPVTVSTTSGGWATAAIVGNTFHTTAPSLPQGVRGLFLLTIQQNNPNGSIIVTGNSFYSSSFPVTSIASRQISSITATVIGTDNSYSPNSPQP